MAKKKYRTTSIRVYPALDALISQYKDANGISTWIGALIQAATIGAKESK